MSEEVDPFAIFANRENAESLAFIGHLEKEVEFCGHTFVLSTLRPSTKAAIAIAVQPWRNTIEEATVWANAHVAMSLQAIDGDTDFCPATGPDPNQFARARLRYITDPQDGWYQPTLDFLYAEYLEIENEALRSLEELRNLSKRSQQPLEPSADSLTAPATSPDETPSDFPSSEPSNSN